MQTCKQIRIVLVALLMAGLLPAVPTSAQVWKKVKKKAKEAVERKAEEKTEDAVDKAVDKTEEGIEATARAVFSSVGDQEADRQKRTLNLGPNATAPAHAPLVRYRSTTSLDMPGIQTLTRLAGQDLSNLSETVTLDATHQRTDQDERSTLLDVASERMITLDHKKKRYTITPFEEMMQIAESAANTGKEQPQQTDETETNFTFNLRVDRTGKREVVNGSDAEQMLLIVQTQFEASGTDDQGQHESVRGTFYTLVDMWITRALAGYETMQAFQQNMAEAMGRQVQQSNFGAMFQAMGQDPRLGASLQKAAEEMRKTEGVPVRSTMYFVLAPIDQELNVEQAMAMPEEQGDGLMQMAQSMGAASGGAEVTEQATILRITTQINDLTVEGIDAGTLTTLPADYEQVDTF